MNTNARELKGKIALITGGNSGTSQIGEKYGRIDILFINAGVLEITTNGIVKAPGVTVSLKPTGVNEFSCGLIADGPRGRSPLK